MATIQELKKAPELSSRDSQSLDEKSEGTLRNDVPRPVKKAKYSWIWDTLDYEPAERKMLFKLDATLLTFGGIGMFCKFLDTNNITNAYVSGMQESLKMTGNQYNYIQTAWTAGYVLGQIPSTLLLNKLRPHIWIPCQEVMWTILTFCIAGARSWQSVCALRFFIGLFEAGYWSCLYWLLGSWYNKRELGKRAALLQLAVQVAPMFSGYLQIAANNGLDGKGGLSGWRWLFLIDGIISLPLSIAAFFLLPDDPSRTGNMVFTPDEIEMAKKRNALAGRAAPTPWTLKKVVDIVSSWETLLFVFYSTMSIIPFQVQTSLIFWLKKQSPKIYSLTQVNALPTLTNGVVAIFLLVFGWVSDGPLGGRRWPLCVFVHLCIIGIDVALLFVPLYGKNNVRLPLYIFSATGSAITPLVFSWMNELCASDAEKRAFILSASNCFKYITTAWFPNVFFQQKHQPDVRSGVQASAIVGGFCVLNLLAILALSIKFPVKRVDVTQVETVDEKKTIEPIS